MMTDLELPPERWGAENDFVDHLIKAVGNAVAITFADRVAEVGCDSRKQSAVVAVIQQIADGCSEVAIASHIHIFLPEFVDAEQRRTAKFAELRRVVLPHLHYCACFIDRHREPADAVWVGAVGNVKTADYTLNGTQSRCFAITDSSCKYDTETPLGIHQSTGNAAESRESISVSAILLLAFEHLPGVGSE